MSDPHYVIARVAFGTICDRGTVDLPDAEHIHIHRLPDGTITATPMRLATTGRDFYSDCRHLHLWEIVQAWVDCPTDPQEEGS